jgi:hypothetical protein
MATAAPPPVAIPVGAIKQFGETGPQYEILGEAPEENGRRMVSICLVQSGEITSVSYESVLESIEAV